MIVLYAIRFHILRGKKNRHMKHTVVQEEKNLFIPGVLSPVCHTAGV